ncbi:MAG: SCP2 sterol-binding domain-containing protein [Deltaproteobacteria bacterium]|nr:SCP2 sterol-binding domain-containing protein [Deltaproteobacteria bacterium]
MTTVRETFENMPASFKPEAAKGMNAVYQFDIVGDGGGKWYAAIADGKLTVGEGQHEKPGVTITMKTEHYLAMAEGKMGGMMAFATGKLKVKGDMILAAKMQAIFKQP